MSIHHPHEFRGSLLVLALRDTFLGPIQVPFDFFGSFHPIREVGTSTFKSSLCEGLQFEELTMLGVELAGAGVGGQMRRGLAVGRTHIWAWRAKLRSNGNGSTAWLRRSLSISTRSTPVAPPCELS